MMNLFIAFISPGGGELLLILLVLILLFGAKDAPRILRNIQDTLNKIQRYAADFRYKLMYGDLHSHPSEESKNTSFYDASEPDEHPEPTPDGEKPPDENESEKYEESV